MQGNPRDDKKVTEVASIHEKKTKKFKRKFRSVGTARAQHNGDLSFEMSRL